MSVSEPPPIGSPPAQAKRSHTGLSMLFNRRFGLLFWGKVLGGAGIGAQSMVTVIVVFEATRSTTMVGLASGAQFVPALLFSVHSGRDADRSGAARQIVLGRSLCVLGSTALALWFAFSGVDSGTVNTVAVIFGNLVVGLGFAVGGAAMQSAVHALVSEDQLATAIALNTLPLTLTRTAGPALGAGITATIGPIWGFAFAAACQCAFLVLVLLIRWPPRMPAPDDADFRILAAARHVWTDRPMLFLLLTVATVGASSEIPSTLGPALAAEYGAVPAAAGWMASCFGAGTTVGVAVSICSKRLLDVGSQGPIGMCVMAAGLAALATSSSMGPALVALSIAGMGMTIALTGLSTVLQKRCPEHLRGRVMALWFVAFVGSRPLAAAFDGVAADIRSVQFAILANVALLTAAALLVLPTHETPPVPRGRGDDRPLVGGWRATRRRNAPL